MVPVVLLDAPGGSYWDDLQHFIRRQLLAGGMIAEEDLSLYRITDNDQLAVDEILQFYRVYHSMRYVKDQLVLRLQQELSQPLLAAINQQFADVLLDGHFVQTAALPEERDEPELKEMPRLVFAFNRRSLGRLRQLIDAINRQV